MTAASRTTTVALSPLRVTRLLATLQIRAAILKVPLMKEILNVIDSQNEIEELIERLAPDAPGLAELLRHVIQGTITGLYQPDRRSNPPQRVLKRAADGPLICLIGDDDYHSTGPAGWKAISRLLSWADGALIHAARGNVATYRLGVHLAQRYGRFLFIETDSAHLEMWRRALAERQIPHHAVVPIDDPHPIPPRPKDQQ
jgi:hypothetical protein